MVINKAELDKSLRLVRGLYRQHAQGILSPSKFADKARTEINHLYMRHTRGLIEDTANLVTEELCSFQTQFALNLDCTLELYQVTRGYRGIRARISVRNRNTHFGFAEIYIGPFDEWDKIAVHTSKELELWKPSSLYTKRKKNRWRNIADFDFPALLQRIKENSKKPPPDLEDEIPF